MLLLDDVQIEKGIKLFEVLDTIERYLIDKALKSTGGNHTHAAHLLGLNRTTFLHKLRRSCLMTPAAGELAAPDSASEHEQDKPL